MPKRLLLSLILGTLAFFFFPCALSCAGGLAFGKSSHSSAATAAATRNFLAVSFLRAGEEFHVHPDVLWAIARVESQFSPLTVHWNKNGSYDYGIMQINSSWARVLGPEVWRRLSDPYTNIRVGAWILAGCIRQYGNTYRAVGCYNSPTTRYQRAYANKVWLALQAAAASGGKLQ